MATLSALEKELKAREKRLADIERKIERAIARAAQDITTDNDRNNFYEDPLKWFNSALTDSNANKKNWPSVLAYGRILKEREALLQGTKDEKNPFAALSIENLEKQAELDQAQREARTSATDLRLQEAAARLDQRIAEMERMRQDKAAPQTGAGAPQSAQQPPEGAAQPQEEIPRPQPKIGQQAAFKKGDHVYLSNGKAIPADYDSLMQAYDQGENIPYGILEEAAYEKQDQESDIANFQREAAAFARKQEEGTKGARLESYNKLDQAGKDEFAASEAARKNPKFATLPPDAQAREVLREKSNLQNEDLEAKNAALHQTSAETQAKETTRVEDALRKASSQTGTDSTFTQTPLWYGGPEGVLMDVIRKGKALSEKPYEAFKGQRTAELTPLQEIAAKEAYNIAGNPDLKGLFASASENLKGATETKLPEVVSGYANPYKAEVMDALQRRMTEHYKKDILPGIEAGYIQRGAWDSSGRADAVKRATEEHMRGVTEALSEVGHRGYESSMQHAAQDLQRQLTGAAELQNLKGTEAKNRMENVALLDTIGARKRAIDQEKKNAEYADYITQKEHPYKQASKYSEIIRGLQPNTAVYQNTLQQPGPNLYQQGAGAVLSGWGLMNQMPKAAGGRVKLADGGMAGMLPEEQDYQNRLAMAANQLDKGSPHPFWNAITNMGSAMTQSKNPRPLGALFESTPAAVTGFKEAQAQDEARRDQALNLRKLIAESRRVQEDRVYKRKLEREEMDWKKFRARTDASKGASSYLTPGERSANIKILKEVSNQRVAARSLDNLYKQLDESFDKFDNKYGKSTWKKPGDIASKIARKFGAENVIYGKALAESDRIKALKSEILKAELAKLPASAAGDVHMQQRILEGIPDITLNPEARKEMILGKRSENKLIELRSSFLNTWSKLNGRDLAQAEEAFDQFRGTIHPDDNKSDIEREMHRFISDVSGNSVSNQEYMDLPEYNSLSEIPDELLDQVG
jgi:hypothetical protein